MILSHRHRFIFIKTRKTAGTSIEISLSRYCGPEDIITPITLEDEPFRGQLGIAAQNFLTDGRGRDRSLQQRALSRWALRAVSALELKRPNSTPYRLRRHLTNWTSSTEMRENGFYNHMPLSEVRQRIDKDVWSSYFTFAFERNPFDKTISDFWYRAKGSSIEEYLSGDQLPVDFPMYSVDGRVAVNQVCRFENLKEELGSALAQVGIDFDGWLPRAKGGTRRSSFTVDDLTADQRTRIRTAFAQEFEAFGYS